MKVILNEIAQLYGTLNVNAADDICNEIQKCEGNIIGLGAGRMGYSLQSFIMRLSHLGFSSYMIGDTTLPRIVAGDLVIVNSSSGETRSVMLLADIAKSHGAKILGLTSGKNSDLARISDLCIFYDKIESMQLMKSAYEQFSFLFFDECAFKLSKHVKLTTDEIETNHSVLE